MRKEQELQQTPLFAGCRSEQLRWIARVADELTLEAGATVVREGETAREFVVVLDGSVVSANGHGPVAHGPGSHFGEIGLIDGGPHRESVVTMSPARVLVFDARAFRGLLEQVPSVSRKLLRELVGRIDQGTRNLRAVS